MKKILIISTLIFAIATTPFFADASELTSQQRSSIQALIQTLLLKLADLQKQLAEIQGSSSKVSQNVASPTTTPVVIVNDLVKNDSVFTSLYFRIYTNNAPAYIGSAIKIKGVVADFLAKGDRGGSSNYILIGDQSGETIMGVLVKINDDLNYQKVIKALHKNDLVNTYGYGLNSEYFTINGQSLLVPVINAVRLDSAGYCGLSGCTGDAYQSSIIFQ